MNYQKQSIMKEWIEDNLVALIYVYVFMFVLMISVDNKNKRLKAKKRTVLKHEFRIISAEEINRNRSKAYEYLKF